MVVQHNMPAINANRYFGMNNNKLSKSLEKLSSGYAINRAGDNAAGLAVSEKMRAQISGLTQASKNAQDGISMTQTFEGALTETDAILQRMRSLAVQSSNGSYDDSVDRAAIQLEYDQLNDELNQIADTDFNGVVVLNGGEMADGLKAVDGKFDYANKQSQIIDEAKTALTAAQAAAQKTYTAAATTFGASNYDLSDNGTAPEWNSVDNNAYDKTAADAIWKALNLDANGDGTGDAVTDVVNKLDVTFTFDGTDWTATQAVGNDKSQITDETLLDAAFATTTAAHDADNTGLGGFTVTNGTVNAIFDATTAKAGDTVTLSFTNGTNETMAPTNIGLNEGSRQITSTGATALTLGVTKGDVADADMTQALFDKFKALEDATFTATYGAADNVLDGATLGGQALANDGVGSTITINDQTFFVVGDAADQPTSFAIMDAAGGNTLATINIVAADTQANTTGSVSGNISLSTYGFVDNAAPVKASVSSSATLESSKINKTAMDSAKATLDKLNATDVSTYDKAKAYLAQSGVSISDSNDASTAKLSYTDNITLQVGARTKDSVNFTFKYESDGLGTLNDDLNCTAKGLGTDKISLATQKDANAAIDKIDNAINKVSMVRGTFGALQNRLEHKIDNLNTTNENLTAAESRIRDTDMATEMMNFTKNQILSQASQAMLAQANTLPQGVLSLLQ